MSAQKREIVTYQINTLEEYMDALPQRLNSSTIPIKLVFRGHSKGWWKLLPSLLRYEYIRRNQYVESNIINEFKRFANPHILSEPSDLLEWIALAQQHGVPTRLLDWTENPLIALFFAVRDAYDESQIQDAAVWSMQGIASFREASTDALTYMDKILGRHEELDIEFPHLASASFHTLQQLDNHSHNYPFFLYYPKHITSRIPAQRSCFTVHPNTNADIASIEDFYEHVSFVLDLRKFIITGKRRVDIRIRLEELGIDQYTLFPDLDGLGKHLRWKIQLENGLRSFDTNREPNANSE